MTSTLVNAQLQLISVIGERNLDIARSMLKLTLFYVFVLAITSVYTEDEGALGEFDDETADDPLSIGTINKAAKAVGKAAKIAQKGANIVDNATAKKSNDELLDGELADDPLFDSAKISPKSIRPATNLPNVRERRIKLSTPWRMNDPLAAHPWRHHGHHPPQGSRNSGSNVNKVNIENNVNVDNN
uniref:Uncharacterized protein n=1 Tax=Romanomermis culicivorax TaxID=13658 RepID=A0A915K6A3_ROMCU